MKRKAAYCYSTGTEQKICRGLSLTGKSKFLKEPGRRNGINAAGELI